MSVLASRDATGFVDNVLLYINANRGGAQILGGEFEHGRPFDFCATAQPVVMENEIGVWRRLPQALF
jgi:hypothetical protein